MRGGDQRGSAAENKAARLLDRPVQCVAGKADRVPTTRDRLGEGGFLGRNAVGDSNQIARRHRQSFREGALARGHGDDLALCTEVFPPRDTVVAGAAGDQRIDRHTGAEAGTVYHHARRLVAEDQGRGPALVMPGPGVHVRATDADMRDVNQRIARVPRWVGRIAEIKSFRSSIDKRLHFAVNPPSTWRIWPVT